jgi:regulator of sirC expression with transglutaminase-like and TPR domain
METNKEISALFTLIDDPDEEVFGAVSSKIVDYGKNIIPNLEHLWETTPNESVQNRIELLIHRLHYTDLTEDFRQWSVSGHHDMMLGAMLVSKFQYPEVSTTQALQEIEKVRRNIWLELNNYLTPLEQVNIVTSILYSYYGLKGGEINYKEPNEFLLHKTLEAKRGNQMSNGILYLVLCELLDIPVRAIKIPKQFILAYFKPGYSDESLPNPVHKIEFFIDPSSGQVFTHQDVESYFKRISVPPVGSYFKPQRNKQVIQQLLEEFSKCFDNGQYGYKKQELLDLSKLLDQS